MAVPWKLILRCGTWRGINVVETLWGLLCRSGEHWGVKWAGPGWSRKHPTCQAGALCGLSFQSFTCAFCSSNIFRFNDTAVPPLLTIAVIMPCHCGSITYPIAARDPCSGTFSCWNVKSDTRQFCISCYSIQLYYFFLIF